MEESKFCKTVVNEKVCACSCVFMRWCIKHFPKLPLPFNTPAAVLHSRYIPIFRASHHLSICWSWKTSSTSSQTHHMSCQAVTCEAIHSCCCVCFAGILPQATRHFMSNGIMLIRKHVCFRSVSCVKVSD